jgi:hypothetical protein
LKFVPTQDAAFVEDHVRRDELPAGIDAGLTERDAVAEGAPVTVTVTDANASLPSLW